MPEQRQLHILLLEDNPQDVFLLQTALSAAGFHHLEVLHSERLADALQFLTENPVDLILTDLNLPDSTGSETVRTLVQNVPDVPILVLSGNNDPDLQLELVRHGASGQISKDLLHTPAFVEAIKSALKNIID